MVTRGALEPFDTAGPKTGLLAWLLSRANSLLVGPRYLLETDPTQRMRSATVGWLSVTTILVQFFFAALNLIRDPAGLLSLGNLALAAFMAANLMVYRHTSKIVAHTVPAMVLTMGWLIWASFRVDPGVLVWTVIFPVPAFFLLGTRLGLVWNSLFCAGVTIALAVHSLPFPARFGVIDIPSTYITVTALSFIGEHTRARFAARLIELSSFDSLTGLLNRRVFEEQGRAELERARRYNHPVALLLMDADHFKSINDRHGHAQGDRVLVAVAEVVRSTLRTIDRVGRWGGEEFAAILPETNLRSAARAAERVRRQAELALAAGRAVTLSIGVTEVSPAETLEAALQRADTALYEAKRAGRNRVSVKSPPRIKRRPGSSRAG